MASRKTDEWQLLFGLLAMQNGIVSSQQLLSAFEKWSEEKTIPLEQWLIRADAIHQRDADVLWRLVETYANRHGGDAKKSLQLLSGSDLPGITAQLSAIDKDLYKTIAGATTTGPRAAHHPGTPTATSPSESGEPRFRILRPLPGAAGGMGEISVASDQELGRQVALKQILSDKADHPLYRQKFQAEAEITGNLEHPGIVPIYGLGTTAEGRPYYAMRLVHGDNLTAHINRFHRPLVKPDYGSIEFHSLVDRLIDVAQAIRYAHSRGVLHRDLKPGNILVGNYGETLVIDWGLARLPTTEETSDTQWADSGSFSNTEPLQIRSGSSLDETRQGQLLGTVGYAPPEQLSGRVDRITERSDVYALGAILYEILVGRVPVSRDEATIADLIQDTLAGNITPPIEARRSVPRALSGVCMKALQRDPDDRYATAAEFIAELERWKADQPVEAAPDSAIERIMRLSRRYRSAAVAAAAALICIAIVTGAALVIVNRSRLNEAAARSKAETLASEKTRLADEKSELAARNRAVVDSFVAAFRSADPKQEGVTRSMTALEVLEQARAQIEGDGPLSRDELTKATLLHAIGTSLVSLGRFQEAIEAHETALNLRRSRLGADDADLLETMNELATGYHAAGRFDQAVTLLEEVCRRRRASLGDEHPYTLRSLTNLASAYDGAGRLNDALPLYEESFQRAQAALGPDHLDTLVAMNNLATGYYVAGRWEDAIPLNEETLKRTEASLGPDHPYTLLSMNNLAYGYQTAGRMDQALPLLEETLRRQVEKLGREHADSIQSMNNLARGYEVMGQLDKALPLYEQTLQLAREQLGGTHIQTLICMNNLASGYFSSGRLNDALPLLKETLEHKRKSLGDDHPSTLRSINNLASGYYTAGDVAAAIPLYEQALQLRQQQLGDQHTDTLASAERLSEALARDRRFTDAKTLLEKWLGHSDIDVELSQLVRLQTTLASCLFELGEFEQAATLAEAALDTDALTVDGRLRAECIRSAAEAFQGDPGAEATAIESYRTFRAQLAQLERHERWWITRACERLVQLFGDSESEQHHKWNAELADVREATAELIKEQ